MRARGFLILLLLLASGTASAFPGAATDVDIAYALSATPVALSMGHLELTGDIRELLLTAGHNESRIGPIPSLRTATADNSGAMESESFENATIVVHRGTFVLRLAADERLPTHTETVYGVGIGVPDAPFGTSNENTTKRPAILLAGINVETAFTWSTRPVDLIFIDATLSILDENGTPVSMWDHRRVNQGASVSDAAGSENPQEGTLFQAEGTFDANLVSAAFGATLGDAPNMGMLVRAAENDRYLEALDALETLGAAMGDAETMTAPAEALRNLASFSGVLNGAIILMAPPGEGDGEATHPLVAYIRGDETELGPFAFMRSEDIEIGWRETEMRIAGRSAVAITGAGASVDAPALVGPIPLISAILYVMAAASIVLRFVWRPPKGNPSILLRLGTAAFGIAVGVGVFYLWDVAFAQTFGTSFLTQASSEAFTSDRLGQLGSIFALQTLPWGIAAIAFALPARIICNVGLRYLGYGKSLKGVGNAGGFAALALFGPTHALWLTNTVIAYLFEYMPPLPSF